VQAIDFTVKPAIYLIQIGHHNKSHDSTNKKATDYLLVAFLLLI